MNDKPLISVNHSARAWATATTTFGIFMEFIQHAAPWLQAHYPDVKWIGPAVTMLGFLWLSIQRVMDANKQASA